MFVKLPDMHYNNVALWHLQVMTTDASHLRTIFVHILPAYLEVFLP